MDQIGNILTDALDPVLTREEVIHKVQEIDSLINDDDEHEDEDEDDDTGEVIED